MPQPPPTPIPKPKDDLQDMLDNPQGYTTPKPPPKPTPQPGSWWRKLLGVG